VVMISSILAFADGIGLAGSERLRGSCQFPIIEASGGRQMPSSPPGPRRRPGACTGTHQLYTSQPG
jgi:hypothetical protein